MHLHGANPEAAAADVEEAAAYLFQSSTIGSTLAFRQPLKLME